jgi:GTP:adenosylcobinamide-phosphate guanylyltransferase
MKYLLLSLLVVSTTVFSAEKMVAQSSMKKKPSISEVDGKSLDISPTSMEEERADETALYTQKHSMKAQVTCKAKDGHVLKAGDEGYEDCLQKAKAELKVEFEKQK